MAHAFDHHNAFLSEGAPLSCGRGLDWKAAVEAGWHGFPASAATKRSEAAPRVSALPRAAAARRTGGKKVEGATPCFLALVRHRAGEMVHSKVHHFPPRFWGRSLHGDPWREGHRVLFHAHGGCVCLRIALYPDCHCMCCNVS